MTPLSDGNLHTDAKMKDALRVLSENADQLFADPSRAATLKSLISEALQSAPVGTGGVSGEGTPSAADLEALAELVHAIVAIEDSILDVEHSARLVLDWIGKGGRSLGID